MSSSVIGIGSDRRQSAFQDHPSFYSRLGRRARRIQPGGNPITDLVATGLRLASKGSKKRESVKIDDLQHDLRSIYDNVIMSEAYKFIRAMKKKNSARVERANNFVKINIKDKSDILNKLFVLPSYLFRAICQETRHPISFSASHLRRSTTREIQPDPYKLFRFPRRERGREKKREREREEENCTKIARVEPRLIFKNVSSLDKGHS